ncbi:MAG: NTP transferase domain-containing protein [Desulfatitalea sp.]
MVKYPISGVLIADARCLAAEGTAAPDGSDPVALERLIAIVAPLLDEILLVTTDPAAVLAQDALIVRDHFDPPGILSAIHAGLFAARHGHALVAGCGLAWPSRPVIELLLEAVEPRWDGVLLACSQGVQPLPAVYAKRCVKLLARQLAEGRSEVDGFLRQIHRHTIEERVVRQCDPGWTPVFKNDIRGHQQPVRSAVGTVPTNSKTQERAMDINTLIAQIKSHPDYARVGMMLCHQGVVRATARDGRPVRGLRVAVDHDRLRQVVAANKKRPGIVEILVAINGERDLLVGDDVMLLLVAGDIRENVIAALSATLDAIKTQVTRKTEYFT